MNRCRAPLLTLLAALVAGCAGTNRRPATPPADAQFGEASWYGLEERGRPTASGEPMDPEAFTAAHRTLPFGTIVEVSDLGSGAAVTVRINDRGPFVAGRIIDLSHAAARRLGIVRQGVARVMLRIVELASEPLLTVQVGAFRSRRAAEELSETLRRAGFPAVTIVEAGALRRVQVGAFRDRRDADGVARTLRNRGYEALVVRLRGGPERIGSPVVRSR